MVILFKLIFGLLADLFRSRATLEAEILVLRQQIIVLRRGKASRSFMAADKLVLGWICRLFPNATRKAYCPKRFYYRRRHKIENYFCRIKDWRRIATRYDKLARNFLAAAALVGALYGSSCESRPRSPDSLQGPFLARPFREARAL